MKNYKIVVSYDGTKYNGWQKQGNTQNTIQEKFENVVSRMCGMPTQIFASGRTDRGVHADGQVANFKCDTDLSCQEVKEYLNHYLPEDILVKSVEEAHPRFHSRLNAVSKTYEYKIATQKPDVFIRKYVFAADRNFDIETMQKGAEMLLGTHDFIGFSSLGKTKKSTIRTINFINITEENGIISVKINGNGFLYNMVRIVVGTLLGIGEGKLPLSVIDEIFEQKSREKAGFTLPAYGLRLVEVFY